MWLTRTIEVRLETVIARPPEEVWAFACDLERLPEWLEEFRAVTKQSQGPSAEGTVFRYTIDPGGRSSSLRLTEWRAGRRLAWDGPSLGMGVGAARPRGSFEVLDAGDGRTRFVTSYRPELEGAAVLLAPVLKRWLRKQRHTDSDRLRTLLERANHPGPAE
jgi:uncharacterized membrane protein